MPNPNKKRLIQNGLLLLLVLVLAAFVWKNQDQARKNRPSTLYDERVGDEASEIRIVREGQADVVLKREEDTWKVTEPLEFVADKEKVRHLFTLLSENAETNYSIEGKDLAQYGLEKERLSVSFNGVKYIFGKLNEISMQRYILKGDTLYLISETVSGLLQQGSDSFKPATKPESAEKS